MEGKGKNKMYGDCDEIAFDSREQNKENINSNLQFDRLAKWEAKQCLEIKKKRTTRIEDISMPEDIKKRKRK